MKRNEAGFTFIETLLVMSITFLLLALVAPNFLNLSSRTSSSTIADALITDIKNQQIKSMTGDTEGRGVPDVYSIYFQPSSYTLFHGQNYSAQDPDNFALPIDSNFVLATTFPGQMIIFSTESGEILNFDEALNQITITEVRTGKTRTIRINKYGTIIQNS